MSDGHHCPRCGVQRRGAVSTPELCPGCLLRLGIDGSRPEPEANLDVTSAEPVRWGPLEVVERLGDGGFGEVYRALDTRLDRSVALKLLRKDPEKLGSVVIGEGRMMARVRHPNVVTVYGAERHDGTVGLWMEFVRGRTLAETVEAGGPLGAHEATAIGLDLCRALAAVHAAGLIHRDIKAQNVMREKGGRVVLMDFGAGQEAERVSDAGLLSGTPLYMAPEVLGGRPSTVRSDLYALGVLLYFLVTGSYPVRARNMKELRAAHDRRESCRLRDERPDLPASFIRAVERALAVDPEQRYASAGEMESALAEAITSSGSEPSPPSAPSEAARTSKPPRRVAVTVTAAVAVVLATVLIALLPRGEPEQGAPTGQERRTEQTEQGEPTATLGSGPVQSPASAEPVEHAVAAPPPVPPSRAAPAGPTAETRRQLDDLDRLAAIHIQQGDYERAEPLIVEALRIRRREYGEQHVEVARSLADLAWCRASARHDDATALFERSLAVLEEIETAAPRQLAAVLMQQATISRTAEGTVLAETLMRRALAVLESTLGGDDPRLAGVLDNLGSLLAASGKSDEAARVLARAQRLRLLAASDAGAEARGKELADLGRATLASTTYCLKAALYRAAAGGPRRLVSGDAVAPGDELFLEIDATETLHLYVINQDEAGNAYVLFPLAGSELQNPLSPGGPHRLPGTRNGNPLHWQISSAGGREHILIVASPQRLNDLEAQLESVPAAGSKVSPTYAALPEPTLRQLRGIGGLVERPAGSEGPAANPSAEGLRIFERAKRLANTTEGARGIWIRQIDLENPPRGERP